MGIAFEKFEAIEKLKKLEEKQKAWLEDYKGLVCCRAKNGKHIDKWKENPIYYDPNNFSYAFNKTARKKDRLVIEFDEVEGQPDNPKEAFEEVKAKLKEKGWGFIHSTHESKNSDYLWVEFTRDITEEEAILFLKWLQPEGSRIDLNFAMDKKIFPVLFAMHWKYNHKYELPVEFFKGEKIDYDTLGIRKSLFSNDIITMNDGFLYETHTKTPKTKNENPSLSGLSILSYDDLTKFKARKDFIVENFLYPQTLTMVYSPPAEFKSLLTSIMGFCITNNREFLGMKTKKCNVLYFDGENSTPIMKERAEAIHKGLGLTRKKFPLYFSQGGNLMDTKKNINKAFLIEMEQFIIENDIKVIVFDTLHRFAFYDENSSDDINKLYTFVFKPLMDTYGISIIFLHHSTKGNGKRVNFRGSSDFLGMVDYSYQVKRKGKLDEFTITNEKARTGEIPNIKGEFVFGNDEENNLEYIRLHKLDVDEEKDEEKSLNKLKEVTNKVLDQFDDTSQLRRRDILDNFDMEGYEYSVKTISRSLRYLVDRKILSKPKTGVYMKVLR